MVCCMSVTIKIVEYNYFRLNFVVYTFFASCSVYNIMCTQTWYQSSIKAKSTLRCFSSY